MTVRNERLCNQFRREDDGVPFAAQMGLSGLDVISPQRQERQEEEEDEEKEKEDEEKEVEEEEKEKEEKEKEKEVELEGKRRACHFQRSVCGCR